VAFPEATRILAADNTAANAFTTNAELPITVFLVDDHRSVLRGLELLINAERPALSVVGTATTIDDAVRLCAANPPDVVTLDLDLGERNGIEAIQQLGAGGRTAVLVLTGIRDPEQHQAAIVAGARGVVRKEAGADTIVKAIRKVREGEIWLDRRSTHSLVSALRASPSPSGHPAIASLTGRERDIVVTLSAHVGAPAKRIAALLGISEHTLRNHLASVYAKVGVSSRLALYEFAQKHGLK
jgi:DNA-binding NarL/FixJ family response regulator